LNHLWSLAQEEQFYLAWPVALLAVRRARNPALVLGLLVVALVVYRDVLVLRGASDARIYFAPDTHVDGLLLGAALAFHRRRRPFNVSRLHLVGAAWTAVLIVALIPALGITEVAFLPVFEGAMVVLVAAAVNGSLPVPRPLVWLGGISYSLYLWHFVVLWAFHWQHQLLAVAVSVVAAYASTVWIERPFRLKREANRPRPVPIPAPTVS
jgi:peptidoglycan/LPS O-acetylase OafA/YrhL